MSEHKPLPPNFPTCASSYEMGEKLYDMYVKGEHVKQEDVEIASQGEHVKQEDVEIASQDGNYLFLVYTWSCILNGLI